MPRGSRGLIQAEVDEKREQLRDLHADLRHYRQRVEDATDAKRSAKIEAHEVIEKAERDGQMRGYPLTAPERWMGVGESKVLRAKLKYLRRNVGLDDKRMDQLDRLIDALADNRDELARARRVAKRSGKHGAKVLERARDFAELTDNAGPQGLTGEELDAYEIDFLAEFTLAGLHEYARVHIRVLKPEALEKAKLDRIDRLTKNDAIELIMRLRAAHRSDRKVSLPDMADLKLKLMEGQIRHTERALASLKRALALSPKALNIYCEVHEFSFDLLLAIGATVRGDRGRTDDLPDIDAKKAGLAAKFAGGVARFVPGIDRGLAYDTGSMSISLRVGLSYGLPGHAGFAARVGLMLVYNAEINVQDDRRFRSVDSFSLVATGKVKMPLAFSASLSAELMRLKTVHVFMDHHHWAAFVAQRWARIVTKVWACDLLDEHTLHHPSKDDLAAILRRAGSFQIGDERVRKVLERAQQFLGPPVTIVHDDGILTRVGASAVVGGGFAGAGVDLGRPQSVEFERWKYASADVTDPVTGVKAPKPRTDTAGQYIEKTTCQVASATFKLKIAFGEASLTYVKVQSHPIPPDDGEYLNIRLSGLASLSFAAQSAPASSSSWDALLHEELAALASSPISVAMAPLQAASLDGSLGIDIGLRRSKQGKWVRQYRRFRMTFKVGATLSIPVFKGLNVDGGAQFSFERTCEEELGTDTILYLLKVYDGLERVPAAGRPDELTGPRLWVRYANEHRAEIVEILKAIASRKPGITQELKELGATNEPSLTVLQGPNRWQYDTFASQDWTDAKEPLKTLTELLKVIRNKLLAARDARWMDGAKHRVDVLPPLAERPLPDGRGTEYYAAESASSGSSQDGFSDLESGEGYPQLSAEATKSASALAKLAVELSLP